MKDLSEVQKGIRSGLHNHEKHAADVEPLLRSPVLCTGGPDRRRDEAVLLLQGLKLKKACTVRALISAASEFNGQSVQDCSSKSGISDAQLQIFGYREGSY